MKMLFQTNDTKSARITFACRKDKDNKPLNFDKHFRKYLWRYCNAYNIIIELLPNSELMFKKGNTRCYNVIVQTDPTNAKKNWNDIQFCQEVNNFVKWMNEKFGFIAFINYYTRTVVYVEENGE